MNSFEKTIAELLRPPKRAYRGESVERLAVARDTVSITDAASYIVSENTENRVGYAMVGYTQAG